MLQCFLGIHGKRLMLGVENRVTQFRSFSVHFYWNIPLILTSCRNHTFNTSYKQKLRLWKCQHSHSHTWYHTNSTKDRYSFVSHWLSVNHCESLSTFHPLICLPKKQSNISSPSIRATWWKSGPSSIAATIHLWFLKKIWQSIEAIHLPTLALNIESNFLPSSLTPNVPSIFQPWADVNVALQVTKSEPLEPLWHGDPPRASLWTNCSTGSLCTFFAFSQPNNAFWHVYRLQLGCIFGSMIFLGLQMLALLALCGSSSLSLRILTCN